MTVHVWRDSRDIESLHVGVKTDYGNFRRLFTSPENCLLELVPWHDQDSIRRLKLNESVECELSIGLPAPY